MLIRVFICALLLGLTIFPPAHAQTTFNQRGIPELSNYFFTDMEWADYDRDGDFDFIGFGRVHEYYSDSRLTLVKNLGNGEFAPVTVATLPRIDGGEIEWADIDNDNDVDIIIAGCDYNCYDMYERTYILLNEGNDLFTSVNTSLPPAQQVSCMDYNLDGYIDIILAENSIHTIYKNSGGLIFEPLEDVVVDVSSASPQWADFDGDSLPDFAIGKFLYKNNGDDSFTEIDLGFVNNGGSRYLWADLDLDGDQDFIRAADSYTYDGTNAHHSYHCAFFENSGDGHFTDRGPLPQIVSFYEKPVKGDFDADGDIDFILSGMDATESPLTVAFFNNGDWLFSTEVLSAESYPMRAVDIDQDNDLDAVNGGVFSMPGIFENTLSTTPAIPQVSSGKESTLVGNILTLSWTEATDDESSTLGYNIYVKRDDQFLITPQASVVTGHSFISGYHNSGMNRSASFDVTKWPDGYYTWSVQAVDNEMNASPFAAPGEFMVSHSPVIDAPTNLTCSLSVSAVTLYWDDRSTSEQSYVVERSSTSGNFGFTELATLPANSNSFEDESIAQVQSYYYRIRMGEKVYSNVIMVNAPPSISIFPTFLADTAFTSTSITLTWEYDGTTHLGFVIQRAPDDQSDFAVIDTLTADARAYTDRSLDTETSYMYRLYAYNDEGRSANSNLVNASTGVHQFFETTIESLAYGFDSYNMAWGDYDNDGYDDVFFGHRQQLFRNNGDGTFIQINDHGINITTIGYHIRSIWGDYDNDGLLDIFLYADYGAKALYKNLGNGTFKSINSEINSDNITVLNASWFDADNDGDLELLTNTQSGTCYYRFDGLNVFTKFPLPMKHDYYNSQQNLAVGDYNGDGFQDIYVCTEGADEFFLNENGLSFKPISFGPLNNSNYSTPFATWADINNDLLPDLTVIQSGMAHIYFSSENGQLTEAYTFPGYGSNQYWLDYDNDGDLDFMAVASYDKENIVYENTGGNLTKRTSLTLNHYPLYYNSFTWVDYNNDGFDDGVTYGTSKSVYQNVPNGNNWLKIRLKGTHSNSTGTGSRIFLKTSQGWQRRDIATFINMMVQQPYVASFGLGEETTVDSIMVEWSSGAIQVLTEISINQVLTIDEKDAQETVFHKPTNLHGKAMPPTSILLEWQDNADDEDQFIVQQSEDGLEFSTITSVQANTTQHLVEGLSLGKHYYFRVVAKKAQQEVSTNIFAHSIHYFTQVSQGHLNIRSSDIAAVSWVDYNGDGFQDLCVADQSFDGDWIYKNRSGETFIRDTTFTIQYGSTLTRSATWGDYDNDGDKDVFFAVGGGFGAIEESLHDKLYKNNGLSGFVKQTTGAIVTDGVGSYMAAWSDINNDSFLDLVVSTNHAILQYQNQNGQSFTKVNSVSTNGGSHVAFTDFDLDNDADLIVSDGNLSIYLNHNGTFSKLNPVMRGGQFVIEDFDGDGYLDILSASPNSISLYLFDSTTKTYTLAPDVFPVSETESLGCNAGDFDNDGRMDVIITNINGPHSILLNRGDLSFERMEVEPVNLLSGYSTTAIADYNADGALDIFFVSEYPSDKYLFKNNCQNNHWIRIALVGNESNRDGFGARIKLFAAGKTQVRELRSATGNYSANEQIAHFGLGETTQIDFIKVEWPSGTIQWIKNPAANQVLFIEENSSVAEVPLAPAELTAATSDDHEITFMWTDNSTTENGFLLERSTVISEDFFPYKLLPANTTTFTDDTGARGAFKFRIRATLDNLQSAPSNIVQIVIVSNERAPEGLQVFPNPASTIMMLHDPQVIQRVNLVTVNGSRVFSDDSVDDVSYHLQLEAIPQGVYILQVHTRVGVKTIKVNIIR